jgi:hypothetical protein
VRPHTKLAAVLLAAATAAGACSSTSGTSLASTTSGRTSSTTATKGSSDPTLAPGRGQSSGTTVTLNIKATVTQRDNGRTVNLHVGDGIAVGLTSTPCAISVNPPDMLVFYTIPTPPNWLYLHAVKRGRGALVAGDSCKSQYTVTIAVS